VCEVVAVRLSVVQRLGPSWESDRPRDALRPGGGRFLKLSIKLHGSIIPHGAACGVESVNLTKQAAVPSCS
jgi:hypothetical protein